MDESNPDVTRIIDTTANSPRIGGHNALPMGTRLGEFELLDLIGEGGFGIVYLAHDHSLDRQVALKEYMPSAFSSRSHDSHVAVISERHRETFTAGMKSFVNEARLLAQFDHPSLIKVYRFWEANGTAYMAMPFIQGLTLKQRLRELGAPPDESWLKSLLTPLLEALEVIHSAQCFHRDIAPDNILLLSDDQPLLLDFGAARRVIGDMTQVLTVILKPGYAPVEQYAEVPGMKQGAWTDIYALAAVIYYAIRGKTPPPSVGRLMNDDMQPLAVAAAGRYSESFLRGIDRCLMVKPEDRPSDIAAMRAALGIRRGETLVQSSSDATRIMPRESVSRSNVTAESRSAIIPAVSIQGSRRALLGVLGGVVAVAVIGGGWWWSRDKDAPQPERTPLPSTLRPQSPAAITTSAPPVVPVAPVPALPEQPLEILNGLFLGRDLEQSVSVAADKSRVKIGRDKLEFRVTSSRAGYLYVLLVGTDRKHLYLLFPNAVDGNNTIPADREIRLPRKGWSMVAGGPPGTNQFLVLVSANRRDFSALGPLKVDPFIEIPLSNVRAAINTSGSLADAAGRVVCAQGSECVDTYGAALFTIEEF